MGKIQNSAASQFFSLFFVSLGLLEALSGCSLVFRGRTLKDGTVVPGDTLELFNQTNSVRATATLGTEPGNAYAVVYNVDPGTLTAAQVKADVLAGVGGARVAVQTIAIPTANTPVTSTIATGLTQSGGATYTVFMVLEGNDSGLAPDSEVKKITGVLPKKLAMQQFTVGVDTPAFAPYGTAAAVDRTVRYLVHLPKGYYDDTTTKWPLILYLHGWGGKSTDTGVNAESNINTLDLAEHFLELVRSTASDIPAIIVAPQCHDIPGSGCWNFQNADWMDNFMEVVVPARYGSRIDFDRVSVTGISSGGGGVVTYTRRKASMLAASVPMSMTATYVADISGICNVANNGVKMWIVHGENDATQPMLQTRGSNDIFNALDACVIGTHFRKFTVVWPSVPAPCTVYAPNCHGTTPIVFETTATGSGVGTPEPLAPELAAELSPLGYSHMIDWMIGQSR